MNEIVKIIFGSHLYGTNTPQSDLDFKSVFIPPARDILLQRITNNISNKRQKYIGEKNASNDVDEEAFSLHKYFDLLAQGQTIALDMLFAPPDYCQIDSYIWRYIFENRLRFLSKNSSSFVGYCRTQANKYGIKGSRVHAVRTIVDWFDAAIAQYGTNTKIRDVFSQDTKFDLNNFIEANALEHTSIVYIDHPSRPDPIPHLECCNRKTPFFSSLKDSRAVYFRLLNEYGTRALMAEKNEGVDWKALSHAVRVANEALELLGTGHITFPLPNAKHTLSIKKGELPYKRVAEEIEELLVKVEEAQQTSVLPDKPDMQFIDDTVVHFYR